MARFSEQHEILRGSRTRARKRFVLKLVLWWGAGLVVAGGIGYALFTTGALVVQEVKIEGVQLADHGKVRMEIVRAASFPPRAWLGEHATLFWLFLNPSEEFLSAFPMFREVTVRVDLFSRVVTIRAEERELYGVWCLSGGSCYAFDREGVVFGKAPATSGTLVTKVMDARDGTFSPGNVVLADPLWRERLLGTLEVIHEVRLTPRVIMVREDMLREWEVALVEGPTLKFSFDFIPERLEDALTSLSRRGDFRALTYLDFRVPDRLYYK